MVISRKFIWKTLIGRIRSSHKSRAGSGTSSVQSSASAKVRPQKKTELQAKPVALQNLQELGIEELRLQQKKAKLKLQAEIAEAEAVERVYKETDVHEAGESYVSHRRTIDPSCLYLSSVGQMRNP